MTNLPTTSSSLLPAPGKSARWLFAYGIMLGPALAILLFFLLGLCLMPYGPGQ